MDRASKITCIFPLCKAKAYARGLCKPHWGCARHLVRTKQTTWEQIEKYGKSKPTRGDKTKQQQWFLTPK